MGRPRNIVLIVADSLRYDSVFSGLPGLPYAMSQATTFSEARSAGCWTLPATASIFTGLLPHEHGATSRSRLLGPALPTLAERFVEGGWSTCQITANVATTDIFGLDRGFEEVVRIWTEVAPVQARLEQLLVLLARPRIREKLLSPRYIAGQLAMDVSAAKVWLQDTVGDIFDRARAKLEASDAAGKQSFLFLNLMETHFPYHVAPSLRTLSEGPAGAIQELHDLFHLVNQTWMIDGNEHIPVDRLRTLRARQRVAWTRLAPTVDAFIRELHEDRDNLVVFLSDHGENFGEQGWLYHFSNVSDAGTRVPLLWLDPSLGGPREIRAPVSSRFLYGALLAAAGLPGGATTLLSSPERATAEMEAFWYDNAGRTRPELRLNQLCFVDGPNRFRYLRGGGGSPCWYTAPRSSATETESRFEPLPIGFDPVREQVQDRERRAELSVIVKGFEAIAARVGP